METKRYGFYERYGYSKLFRIVQAWEALEWEQVLVMFAHDQGHRK